MRVSKFKLIWMIIWIIFIGIGLKDALEFKQSHVLIFNDLKPVSIQKSEKLFQDKALSKLLEEIQKNGVEGTFIEVLMKRNEVITKTYIGDPRWIGRYVLYERYAGVVLPDKLTLYCKLKESDVRTTEVIKNQIKRMGYGYGYQNSGIEFLSIQLFFLFLWIILFKRILYHKLKVAFSWSEHQKEIAKIGLNISAGIIICGILLTILQYQGFYKFVELLSSDNWGIAIQQQFKIWTHRFETGVLFEQLQLVLNLTVNIAMLFGLLVINHSFFKVRLK